MTLQLVRSYCVSSAISRIPNEIVEQAATPTVWARRAALLRDVWTIGAHCCRLVPRTRRADVTTGICGTTH